MIKNSIKLAIYFILVLQIDGCFISRSRNIISRSNADSIIDDHNDWIVNIPIAEQDNLLQLKYLECLDSMQINHLNAQCN